MLILGEVKKTKKKTGRELTAHRKRERMRERAEREAMFETANKRERENVGEN